MLGDILRNEREKRGLTIKDVERGTSIRSLYIDCIEKSEYTSLPKEVYVRGFIKNYAAFLDLNVEWIMQQYREERNLPEEESRVFGKKKDEELFHSGADFKERVENSHRSQGMMIVAIIIVVGFLGSIFYFFGTDEFLAKEQKVAIQSEQKENVKALAKKQEEKTEKKVAVGSKQNEEKVKSEKTDSLNKKETAVGKTKEKDEKKAELAKEPLNSTVDSATMLPMSIGGLKLKASFSEYCWMQVVADGKTVFEGTANSGESLNWEAKEKFFVVIGNAGAVELFVNGETKGKAGKIGEVVEKTFVSSDIVEKR